MILKIKPNHERIILNSFLITKTLKSSISHKLVGLRIFLNHPLNPTCQGHSNDTKNGPQFSKIFNFDFSQKINNSYTMGLNATKPP
jgi:hypothetical protein